MQNNDRKPKIRFSGFEAGWKKKCFGDEFDILSNNTLSRDFLNYDQGIAKNVHYGDVLIKFNEYLDASKEVLPYIEDEKVIDKFKNSFLRDGDIVIADTAEDETVGKCTEIGQISDLPIIAGLHTMPCRPKAKYAPMYLGYYLNANAYHRELLPLMQGIKVTSISRSGVKDTDIIVSEEYDEQKKIGQFLFTLDEKIKFEQDKLERLIILKKMMLEKMFPQGNSKVPEIRFGEYTDEWEQRKVSEVTKFHKQGFYTTESYGENKKYYLLRGTDLTENKLVLKDTPKIDATENDYKAFKTEIGDFLIVRSGTVGTYGIVNVDIPAIFGSYLIDFRFDMSMVTNEFFGYFYQSSLFKNQLRQIIQQSANTNINAENIKLTMVKLPSVEEQKKIGTFFENIDNLITLHQRKVDKLKNIKSSCMDKMFV